MDNKNTFKEFSDKVNTHNKQDLALQALQVKYERELAGEDDKKHREQLDKISKILSRIEKSVTGINIDNVVKPIQSELENQTKILKNLLEEQSITRKITEGSLSFDNNKGQYRNKSGREFASDVTGKTVKKGGFEIGRAHV